MVIRMCFVSAVVVALVATAGITLAAGNSYSAHLSGPFSKAQGQTHVKFSSDGESLAFKVNVANIVDVTVAHIHVSAAPGGDGPPALWLYPSAPPPQLIPGRFQGTLAQGTATAANLVGPLAGGTLEDLRTAIEEGRAYINVHTSAHPAGEIRGELG